MRKYAVGFVTVGLLCLAAVAGGSPQGEPKIEGTWQALSGSSDGKKIPEDFLKNNTMLVEFKDGKYAVTVNGKKEESGTYKIDGNKKPANIDMTIADGKDKGKTQLGIFKLEGDRLSFAMGKAGNKERPKTFDGGEGIETVELKKK